MLSNASLWFLGLPEESRAYHTCVSTDEAFLRAFRSTSFRIRTREELRKQQWLQQDGRKKNDSEDGTSDLEKSSASITEHQAGGSRTGPTTETGSIIANPNSPSFEQNGNAEQEQTLNHEEYCITSSSAANDCSTNESSAATRDKSRNCSFVSSNKINECLHNLLSNIVVVLSCPASNGTTKRESTRKLRFATSFLTDPTAFFNTVNAVLKDENPAYQFLDPRTTWPQWYDGNDDTMLKGVTERKFILHMIALVDMNIRSAHRQWLVQRDEVATASTSNTTTESMSLYDYLEFMERKVKTAPPPQVQVNASGKDELLDELISESTSTKEVAASKTTKRKKRSRKREPKQLVPRSTMETSEKQVSSNHLNIIEQESTTDCCSSSIILASVHSNKENGENSIPSNSESTKATLRTSSTINSSNYHPLAEVNFCSTTEHSSMIPALESLPKAKIIDKGDEAEEAWTVVSKKGSVSSSISQVKTKVKALPRQPSYVSVVTSSSNNSASKATPNIPNLLSSSSSSIASSSVQPKSVTVAEKHSLGSVHSTTTFNNNYIPSQAKPSFSSIAAGITTVSQSSDKVNLTRQHSEASNITKNSVPPSDLEKQHSKPNNIGITADVEAAAISKKSHVQHNRSNLYPSQSSSSQRHQRNSSYSIHLTVRQAPTSPKKYHPQSQRQQSCGSSVDNTKKNMHPKLALPSIGPSSQPQKSSYAARVRRPSADDCQPSVPVPLLFGIESNSASSSVSSSLDGPSASMPRLRRQDECKARRSAKITEEGYHLLNSCEKLSSDIDFFMERRSAALVVRRNERRLLLGALQGTIDSMCSSSTKRRHRCFAEMYGSCATQLDLPSSDLDVVVRGMPFMPIDPSSLGFGQTGNHHYYLPPHPNAAHVMRLAAELEREPWAVHIKPIPTALVPVVKILADPSRLPSVLGGKTPLTYPLCETSKNNSSSTDMEPTVSVMNQWRGADVLNGLLSVDITFEGPGHGGIGSTAFAAKVVQDACDESNLVLEKTPLVQVFMVLKELLAQRRLNEPFSGGLSSYSLLLLVCAVTKDVENLRKSLSFSDTRKQCKDTGSISPEQSCDEGSLTSANTPTCIRDSSSGETPAEGIASSDGIGTSSSELEKPDDEQTRETVPKCKIIESVDTEAPPKKELFSQTKCIQARSGTVSTTACSSVNGAVSELATESTVPSCSFFAQAGTGSNDILEVLCRGEPSSGKLLMHFLLFYGKLFDSKTTSIDINARGSPFVARKPGGSMDPATGMFSVDQIVICDPLEGAGGHNVARSCFAWHSVRQVFSQCYATLVQSIESYGIGAMDANDAAPLLALLLSY